MRSSSKRQVLAKANLLLMDHFDDQDMKQEPVAVTTRSWK